MVGRTAFLRVLEQDIPDIKLFTKWRIVFLQSAVQHVAERGALDPDHAAAHSVLGFSLIMKGEYEAAIESFERSLADFGESPVVVANLGYALARVGRGEEARATLAALEELSAQRFVSPAHRALVHLGLGEREASLDWLAAATHGFTPVPMRLQASFSIRNAIRRSTSRNVVAVVPGSTRPDEYVIYMAHWDHLGMDTTLAGDQIYNGGQDNATGTAGLLLLAKAFMDVEPRPERSVVFLAVTAEEQGLLGSAYYASQPLFPLDHTVAAINMDVLNVYGPTRDVTVVGLGQSELDDYLADAVKAQGRTIRPDPTPSAGSYYRSDHFNFAKVGVPALYPDAGIDNIEHGEAWAKEQAEHYRADQYHKPSDEYDPNWNLEGALEDLELVFAVGFRLANEQGWPNWKQGSEFKARRDAMMAAQ